MKNNKNKKEEKKQTNKKTKIYTHITYTQNKNIYIIDINISIYQPPP